MVLKTTRVMTALRMIETAPIKKVMTKMRGRVNS